MAKTQNLRLYLYIFHQHFKMASVLFFLFSRSYLSLHWSNTDTKVQANERKTMLRFKRRLQSVVVINTIFHNFIYNIMNIKKSWPIKWSSNLRKKPPTWLPSYSNYLHLMHHIHMYQDDECLYLWLTICLGKRNFYKQIRIFMMIFGSLLGSTHCIPVLSNVY